MTGWRLGEPRCPAASLRFPHPTPYSVWRNDYFALGFMLQLTVLCVYVWVYVIPWWCHRRTRTAVLYQQVKWRAERSIWPAPCDPSRLYTPLTATSTPTEGSKETKREKLCNNNVSVSDAFHFALTLMDSKTLMHMHTFHFLGGARRLPKINSTLMETLHLTSYRNSLV